MSFNNDKLSSWNDFGRNFVMFFDVEDDGSNQSIHIWLLMPVNLSKMHCILLTWIRSDSTIVEDSCQANFYSLESIIYFAYSCCISEQSRDVWCLRQTARHWFPNTQRDPRGSVEFRYRSRYLMFSSKRYLWVPHCKWYWHKMVFWKWDFASTT